MTECQEVAQNIFDKMPEYMRKRWARYDPLQVDNRLDYLVFDCGMDPRSITILANVLEAVESLCRKVYDHD